MSIDAGGGSMTTPLNGGGGGGGRPHTATTTLGVHVHVDDVSSAVTTADVVNGAAASFQHSNTSSLSDDEVGYAGVLSNNSHCQIAKHIVSQPLSEIFE